VLLCVIMFNFASMFIFGCVSDSAQIVFSLPSAFSIVKQCMPSA
jgi:hypothetical protein